MNHIDDEAIRAAVRDHYASVATGTIKDDPVSPESGSGCCAPSCCGGSTSSSLKVGYLPEDILNAADRLR
jgi:hypothetical protein